MKFKGSDIKQGPGVAEGRKKVKQFALEVSLSGAVNCPPVISMVMLRMLQALHAGNASFKKSCSCSIGLGTCLLLGS
jgi:hypothetical protein